MKTVILIIILISSKCFSMDLTFCPVNSLLDFDPAKMFDVTSLTLKNIVYENLFELTNDKKIAPVLAEKSELSKDGKVLTILLKKNINFHFNSIFKPTRPMNAEDILFTFKRQMKQYNSSESIKEFKSWKMSELADNLIDIKKENDYSVTFYFKKPTGNFLRLLISDSTMIVSKEYFDKFPKYFEINPIGTGPLMASEITNRDDFTLVRHEKYHGKGKLKSLRYLFLRDTDQIHLALKKGECDLIDSPPVFYIKEAIQSGKYKKVISPEFNITYLAFNTAKKPLDRPDVRKAITLALNLKLYLGEIYLDFAKIASLPIPPALLEYPPNFIPFTQDINLSKELLKKHGLANGFNLTIWTFDIPRPYLPDGYKLARLIKNDLAKVKINVKIMTLPFDELQRRVQRGEHDLVLAGWANTNHLKDIFSKLICYPERNGINESNWCNKQFDQLYQEISLEHDLRKRQELTKKAMILFKQELPWAPLFYTGKTYLVKSSLPENIFEWYEFRNQLNDNQID